MNATNHKYKQSSDAAWIPDLVQFIESEKNVEAILFDSEHKQISIATIGDVDLKLLQRNLTKTLQSIEQNLAEGQLPKPHPPKERISIHPVTGKTLIEKPTCITAPRFWVWREFKWPKAGKEHEHHDHNWKQLALLAAICGTLGIAGFILKQFSAISEWIPALCFILSMIAGGWDAAKDVADELPEKKLDIHFLMLAVAVGASFIGAFQEGALLLFLFSFSGALEHFALDRTRNAIDSLFKTAPKTALIINAQGEEQTIPIDQVTPGTKIIIKPGDLFPVDAEIISGKTASDESTLTGEATPVEKNIGDTVFSGTLNLWGAVQAKTIRPAHESSLQRIIRLIQEAQHLKAPSQRFTDKFGTPYTYLILSTTVLMFLVWWLFFGIEPFSNYGDTYSAFYRAMTLLVVASPCALVLSIPSAILAAIAWGARHGILFRGGAAIERLAEIDVVALDKTGTLTTGDLIVERIESFPKGQEDKVLQLAVSLEAKANHPIAQAILRYGKENNIKPQEVSHFESLTGHGIQGCTEEVLCVLGRRELLELGPLAEWIKDVEQPEEEYTEVWVVQKKLIGRLLLKDKIREASKPVLEILKSKKIHTVMLTGDRRQAAESIGKALGIQEVMSGLKPEDKVRIIKEYTDQGKKAAMVGDGINDAPSLAAAYVSIAMGARGSDAALEQSEVILMNDRIDNFLEALQLSRHARRVIKQNLIISLGTIIIMVLSASFGLVPLALGVFAHEGSTVLVCLNSLRLLIRKKATIPLLA